MTDDPEITDPRDPYKQRDIVAELDRWIVSQASLREATVSHALLQAARREIVALRRTIQLGPDLPALAREQALEEAAQVCSLMEDRDNFDCAAAIRALKRLRGN